MGVPMAINILKKGRQVLAFDIDENRKQSVVDAGAVRGDSVAHLAKECSVIITMLPKAQHVEDVYLGKQGVLEELTKANRPPTYLIDSSSVDIKTAQKVGEAMAAGGHMMVDAPVSGGVGGAAAGTLTFMVGGNEDDVMALGPLLSLMGSKVFHCGGIGKGQAVKVCNNLIMGISMAAVSEGFALAETLGVDAKTFFEVAKCSSGRCWSCDTYNPVPGLTPKAPSNSDYNSGFMIQLLLKDLNNAIAANKQKAALKLPMLNEATDVYSKIADAGFGAKDFSYVYKTLKTEK